MLRIQQFNQHLWNKWRWAETGRSFPPLLPLSTCHTCSALCPQSPFLTNKEKHYLPHSLHRDGLPRWYSGLKNLPPQAGDAGSTLGQEIPWRRKWQPTAVFLPGKFHEQRSLVAYSPWGCKKSDTTEHVRVLVTL